MAKELTLTSKVLLTMLAAGSSLSVFFPSSAEFRKRRALFTPSFSSHKQMERTIKYMVQKGWLKMEDKNNKRFVKLTKKGELEALLAKAKVPFKEKSWDGKWRLIIFDIPEESRDKRNHFRYLVKQMGFKKLQASVFISPWTINREALNYLKDSGLISYIRILKVEEIDYDLDLKKKFGLI